MLNIEYQKGHIKALDGLRGVAIILVLFFHCSRFEFPPIRAISAFGWTGVDLFFVLSGFLITGILIDSKEREGYYKNFFMKRILRIFPLYYLVLCLCLLPIYFIDLEVIAYYANHQLYFWTYTQNLLFAFQGWPENTRFLNHFWSLAIEEQFYIFWPFVIGLLNRRNGIVACISLIIISLVFRNIIAEEPFAYTFTFARVDALSIGALAAFLIRGNTALLNKWVVPVGLVAFFSLVSIYLHTRIPSVHNIYFIRIGYTLFALFYVSVLLSCFSTNGLGKAVSRLLSFSFFRFFGKYSYGIYVYHWIIYILWYHDLYRPFQFMGNFFFIPFVGIVVLVSMVSYHVFEAQFLRLKKRFH